MRLGRSTLPARYFRKYGFRGLLDRTLNYPLRPIRRRLDQKAALAEARSYEAALARARSTDHPLPKILFYPDCPAPSSAIFKMWVDISSTHMSSFPRKLDFVYFVA